jgi:hypothetical protein
LIDGKEAIDHEAEVAPASKTNPTKSVLRLPDLEHAKAAVLNSLTSLDAQGVIGTPSTNSLPGIVPSLAWLSIVPWSFVTIHTLNLVSWRRARSTYALVRYAAWRTRRRTAVYSVPI